MEDSEFEFDKGEGGTGGMLDSDEGSTIVSH